MMVEYAAPVSSITKKQSSQIESVQKLAFRIILKQSYSSYKNACSFFQTVTLKQRRLEICSRFALKNVESSNSLFKLAENDPRLRTRKTRVLEYKCRTKRYQRSSLPFLASLLNSSGLATWSPVANSYNLVYVNCGLWGTCLAFVSRSCILVESYACFFTGIPRP